jgi:hypothetical protein
VGRKRLIRDLIVSIRNILKQLERFHFDQATPRQLTAHHEAGHAVAAVAFGIGFDRVSVVDDRDVLGRIVLDQKWPHHRPAFNPHDPEGRRIAEGWIVLALAGEFADAYHSGRKAGRSPGASWDFRIAEELAERLFAHLGEREAFLNEMRCWAHQFVSEPLRWRQISAVATRLDQLRELDRRQVAQIMDEIAAAGDSSGTEDRNRDVVNS